MSSTGSMEGRGRCGGGEEEGDESLKMSGVGGRGRFMVHSLRRDAGWNRRGATGMGMMTIAQDVWVRVSDFLLRFLGDMVTLRGKDQM